MKAVVFGIRVVSSTNQGIKAGGGIRVIKKPLPR